MLHLKIKMSAVFVIIIAALIESISTDIRVDTRIVGGNAATIQEVPYQASVQYLGMHVCGGVIISPKFVLTAAHCIVKNSPLFITVRVGTSFINDEGMVLDTKKIYLHPKFERFVELDFDIAVLELMNELTFGSTINVVKLPKSTENFVTGTPAVVSGWGQTMDGVPLSIQLQTTVVFILDFYACQKTYKDYQDLKVSARMICAGLEKGGADHCKGDSGGPLVSVINKTLIGLVSWGDECGSAIFPGVYSSVAKYRDFIKEIVGF